MFYLITQIWLQLLLAFALGGVATWWWLTSKADVRREQSTAGPGPRPGTSQVESLRHQLEAARSDARAAREALAVRTKELEELKRSASATRDSQGSEAGEAEASHTRPQPKEDAHDAGRAESVTPSSTSPEPDESATIQRPPTGSRPLTPRLPDALVEHARAETDQRDDLTRIRGVGPVLARMLNEMGINTFREIALWSQEDVDRVQARLPRFPGSIRRDDWVGQAAELDRTQP